MNTEITKEELEHWMKLQKMIDRIAKKAGENFEKMGEILYKAYTK